MRPAAAPSVPQRMAEGAAVVLTHRSGRSPLHAARPAIGAAYCLALVTVTLTITHPLPLAGLLVAVLGAGAATGSLAAQRRALVLALPLALLVVAINGLAVRHGTTVVARLGTVPGIGRIDVTAEALVTGALLGLRLVIVLLASVLLARCVDPDGLLRGLRRRWPAAAVTAGVALRMVPVLARDGARMAAARRARPAGVPGAHGERAARLLVLRSLTGSVLDRAGEVATTLELRGHGLAAGRRGRGGPRRPPAPRVAWSRHDRALAAVATLLTAVALAIVASRVAGGSGALLVRTVGLDVDPRLHLTAGAATVALALAAPLVAVLPLLSRRGTG